MESRSPYPKLWKEWRSYKIVLWVIRSPLNYLQYLAKWDPKRGVTPICTFRYVRSGTQILHHVPGSFGNPFSKKLPWFLSILIWKKIYFWKFSVLHFLLSKKTRQKQGGNTEWYFAGSSIWCVIVASFVRMTGEDQLSKKNYKDKDKDVDIHQHYGRRRVSAL